jgi:hypothetical protein
VVFGILNEVQATQTWFQDARGAARSEDEKMNMSLRDALANLYRRFDADQHRERYAAATDLIADEEKRRVRQVGHRAPEFALADPDFGNVISSECLRRGPLIVNFYRGLWWLLLSARPPQPSTTHARHPQSQRVCRCDNARPYRGRIGDRSRYVAWDRPVDFTHAGPLRHWARWRHHFCERRC